eukprot:9474416-Pyramimonas_sp.AAC.1
MEPFGLVPAPPPQTHIWGLGIEPFDLTPTLTYTHRPANKAARVRFHPLVPFRRDLPGAFAHLPGAFTHLPGAFTHLPGAFAHLPGAFAHLP